MKDCEGKDTSHANEKLGSNIGKLTKKFDQSDVVEQVFRGVEEVVANRRDLLTWAKRDDLVEHLNEIDNIGLLIERPMSPTSDLERLAQQSEHWKPDHYDWSLMLMVIENLHTKYQADKQADDGEEGDTEEEVQSDSEEATVFEDREMQDLGGALKDNFTYINQITVIMNSTLNNSPVANRHYTQAKSLFQRAVEAWEWFKEFVGKVSEFFGINLVFVGWLWVMKKVPLIGVVTKIIGTLVALTGVLLVIIILPIWRFFQNPIDRLVKFFSKLLKITPPVEEEEI
ncbi:MAG: hypothetical protein OEU92_26970 [Alphaproteobacteria bacterium]|nr:hypothetical protein [Alphaproteobacteria bacterium]